MRSMHGWEMKAWHNDWEDLLCDEGYQEYVAAHGVIYKVDNTEIDPYDDVYEAEKQPDGSYRYTLKYYNGGCCFSEAIETALERAEEG